jgi:carbonic anhydrase/acetyltransferase-like protein (isoleucine patch superfamily)/predicted GNAT superfamily acetyltransferase
MIRDTKTKKTNVHPDTFIAESADVVGDVTIGEGSSLWHGSVARGDMNYINIGKHTNIQDNATLHVDSYEPLEIGNYTTVGHNAVVHGCKVGSNCLIGMGAILLNRAQIGDNCIIGAGALITEGMIIPPNSLVMGAPGKIKRDIREEEIKTVEYNAIRYEKLWRKEYGPDTDVLTIRPAKPEDYDEILRLNRESVHFLSPMTRERLEHLHSQGEILAVAAEGEKILAFCLAMREGADYDSVNYTWFSGRYDKFLYIDRVVVDIDKKSAGIGTNMYQKIIDHAKKTGIDLITAEIDISPPNPVSLQFHRKFGFHEVGKQRVANGEKEVSLQALEV